MRIFLELGGAAVHWPSAIGIAQERARQPAGATGRFFGILLALEIAILIFFTVYGALEQLVLQPKLNLTVWGI